MTYKSKIEKAIKNAFGKIYIHCAETGSEYIIGTNEEGIKFVVRFSDHEPVYLNAGVFINASDFDDCAEIINEIKKGKNSNFYIGYRELREIENASKREIGKRYKEQYGDLYNRYIEFLEKNQELEFHGNRVEARELKKLFGIPCPFLWALKRKAINFNSFVRACESFNKNN